MKAINSKTKQVQLDESQQKALDALVKYRGIFKGKGKAKTDEEWHAWRIKYSEKRFKELDKKFGIKD